MTRPPSGPLPPGPTSLGRYRLVRHLAAGGMGDVYLAEATGAAGFAKRVVVKTVRADLANDAALAQQLVAEGRLLEALDHPNIAQILDLGQDGDTFWLAMEYVDGHDLRTLLRQVTGGAGRGRLSPVAVLHLIASVARALEHARTRLGPDGKPLMVVHHDVSPSNVMVRRDGHVKLVDFGVAKAALLGKMAPAALRGKLPYLSPEHAAQRPVDGRSDLFALGLVAWECLMGERALEVTEPDRLAHAHARLDSRVAQLRAAQGPGSAVAELVAALLSADPAQRPATAGEVAASAERALHGLGESSPAGRLADELAPAFARVAARVGSFDATLAGILGLADSSPASDRTGTLSLPGLDVVSIAAASARDDGGAARRRWKKRWVFAGVSAAVLAVAGGYWAGRRAEPPEPQPASGAAMALEAPNPSAPAPVAAPAAAIAAPATPAAVAQAEPVAPSAAATLAEADPDPAADPKHLAHGKPAAKPDRTATVLFRVRPFGCRVTVDGELRKPLAGSDRYEIKVAPGNHRLTVEDPVGGLKKTVLLKDIADGETRTLPGGICLGADCPEGP